MYNLKSITTIKVLYKLLEASNFNKGTVDISTTRRQTICKELGISDTSFSKALRSLIELNIFSGHMLLMQRYFEKEITKLEKHYLILGVKLQSNQMMNLKLKNRRFILLFFNFYFRNRFFSDNYIICFDFRGLLYKEL